jgi:hypothetical protein
LNGIAARGVTVIAICPPDCDAAAIAQAAGGEPPRYRVARDKPPASGTRGVTRAKYRMAKLPSCYVIDESGIIRYQDIPLTTVAAALDTLEAR